MFACFSGKSAKRLLEVVLDLMRVAQNGPGGEWIEDSHCFMSTGGAHRVVFGTQQGSGVSKYLRPYLRLVYVKLRFGVF